MLRLLCEVEGRAATLRQEALQCLTIALAGSSAVGLGNLIKTFFGSSEDDQHVWDFIDPKSKIAKLFYISGGWSTHMRNCHVKVPWFKSQVCGTQDEQQEAEDLLERVEADPTSLSSQARCQDTILLEAFEEDTRIIVLRDIKQEELKTVQEDIEFPKEEEVVSPKPPSPTYDHVYGGSVDPDGHQICYRVKWSLESEEEGPSKKPKGDE